MARTLTIQIKPAAEALEDFRETFRAVAAGRRAARRDGVFFTSIEAARNLLTPARLALLRAIRARRPASVYELAKLVGRDLKNVQDDLRLLETYGLVHLREGTSHGRRKSHIPSADWTAPASVPLPRRNEPKDEESGRHRMNVFELRQPLVDDCASYIQSFLDVAAPHIRTHATDSLDASLLWPDPLIELSPSFEPGHTIADIERGSSDWPALSSPRIAGPGS